jgi:hypothetical protein
MLLILASTLGSKQSVPHSGMQTLVNSEAVFLVMSDPSMNEL